MSWVLRPLGVALACADTFGIYLADLPRPARWLQARVLILMILMFSAPQVGLGTFGSGCICCGLRQRLLCMCASDSVECGAADLLFFQCRCITLFVCLFVCFFGCPYTAASSIENFEDFFLIHPGPELGVVTIRWHSMPCCRNAHVFSSLV